MTCVQPARQDVAALSEYRPSHTPQVCIRGYYSPFASAPLFIPPQLRDPSFLGLEARMHPSAFHCLHRLPVQVGTSSNMQCR